MMRRARIGLPLALGLGLAVSLLACRAAASKTFPEALRQKLELPQLAGTGMGCQLCHQDDTGGLMTATKPFGRTLIQAGVQAANVPSLLSALTRLEADGHDSDHDGTPDITELRAGTDPNVATISDGGGGSDGGDDIPGPPEEIPLAQTGCTLTANTASGSAWAPLALGFLLLKRRRRAR